MTADGLAQFLDTVCTDSHLRVETDFGGGFVRLRSSEAERRQAAQDIRSSEDAVIELLRNSRDAHAKHIFLSIHREGSKRHITIIDDGDGIPASMHERIFDPRVTSKLDSAHMDKWGMHGRGMALYSICVNADEARVASSDSGLGAAISVICDTDKLGEKTDQSTFPTFVATEDGAMAMRGPKNILRTACEFALEHRGLCTVFCGSPVEIASLLYFYGVSTVSRAQLAFCANPHDLPLCKRLAAAGDTAHFAELATEMGLPVSERSARRIMDGEEARIDSLMDRMSRCSFPQVVSTASVSDAKRNSSDTVRDERRLKLANEDVAAMSEAIKEAFSDIAERYYLQQGDPKIKVTQDAVVVTIPIEKLR